MNYDLFWRDAILHPGNIRLSKTPCFPESKRSLNVSMVEILCEKEEQEEAVAYRAAMHFYPEAVTPGTAGLARAINVC